MRPFLEKQLETIRGQNLFRSLRRVESGQGAVLRLEGREVHNFSSNDYLGLAGDESLRKAADEATARFGTGCGASRLISGNVSPASELERDLARFKQTEAALVYSSGYAAALGTIPALVGPDDAVILDKLCHACLVDACRLSGATIRVYPHGNLKKLEELLKWAKGRRISGSQTLVVTETVFSMDGDLAPLADIAELKQKHDAWLMIDEAHATGVFGKHGRGAAELFGVEDQVDVVMGTLGKALGSCGGTIAGSNQLVEFLINRARSFIFSTALPPAAYASASAAIRQVETRPELRARLWKNVEWLAGVLNQEPVSPILPFEIGDEARALETSQQLLEAGYFVPAVRYPTVARGKARLRISVSAAHTEEQLNGLAHRLKGLRPS